MSYVYIVFSLEDYLFDYDDFIWQMKEKWPFAEAKIISTETGGMVDWDTKTPDERSPFRQFLQ